MPDNRQHALALQYTSLYYNIIGYAEHLRQRSSYESTSKFSKSIFETDIWQIKLTGGHRGPRVL